MSAPGPLKLRGEDAEDLQVIAACLQDAIVTVSDMAFLPAEHRFVALLNRFRWEACGELPDKSAGGERPERVHSLLRFERVLAAQTKGLDRHRRGRLLELLTVRAEELTVDLVFAEGVSVRLAVEAIRCFVDDVGEGWPTLWRPRHPADSVETTP